MGDGGQRFGGGEIRHARKLNFRKLCRLHGGNLLERGIEHLHRRPKVLA